MSKMNSEQRIFLTVGFFLIIATFVYVLSGILGLSLPRYYPELGRWSAIKLEGPSMGYYGKIGFTLLLSLPLSFFFYLFLPRLNRTLKINPDFWRGLTTGTLILGTFFFVAEEWHKWGVGVPNSLALR